MIQQKMITDMQALDACLKAAGAQSILLVCGSSLQLLALNEYFETLEGRLGIRVVRFSDFQPNPELASAVKGIECYRANRCNFIIAAGGGSAMDVAKCIKLYTNSDSECIYPEQEIIPNDIPLLAIPTTAGSGSEATRFAVVYVNGEKQSMTHESCIPFAVLLDADVLRPLPLYQRKATMLDALCHAVESLWSVHANDESRGYAREAIALVLQNAEGYLANENAGNAGMLRAANLAGRAINITQTTAGHAMCYKLTTLYGIAHGHAAALCVRVLFPHMIQHTEHCIDPRGEAYLKSALSEIAEAMGCESPLQAAEKFAALVERLAFPAVTLREASELDMLKRSVNPERLRNHPVALTTEVLGALYEEILGE